MANMAESASFVTTHIWVQILTLPATSFVIMGKLPNFTVSQLSYLKHRKNITNYLEGLL